MNLLLRVQHARRECECSTRAPSLQAHSSLQHRHSQPSTQKATRLPLISPTQSYQPPQRAPQPWRSPSLRAPGVTLWITPSLRPAPGTRPPAALATPQRIGGASRPTSPLAACAWQAPRWRRTFRQGGAFTAPKAARGGRSPRRLTGDLSPRGLPQLSAVRDSVGTRWAAQWAGCVPRLRPAPAPGAPRRRPGARANRRQSLRPTRLQVRRSSYHDVVKMADISRFADIAGIQGELRALCRSILSCVKWPAGGAYAAARQCGFGTAITPWRQLLANLLSNRSLAHIVVKSRGWLGGRALSCPDSATAQRRLCCHTTSVARKPAPSLPALPRHVRHVIPFCPCSPIPALLQATPSTVPRSSSCVAARSRGPPRAPSAPRSARCAAGTCRTCRSSARCSASWTAWRA